MPTNPLPTTTPIFVCPQCRAPVRANDSTCRACGVNLALAAVVAERLTLARMPAPAPSRTADLPRFGEFLVNAGYLTPEQLHAALARQREMAALGSRQTIGQVLLNMQLLTREQLELASVQQVRQLQSALEESNRQLEQRVAERTQALEAALERLTELEELKANFVANISHELRTPLVPLRGYADLLLSGSLGGLTPHQRDALEVISRSTRRLEELINELIQFASSVKGKMVINPTLVAVDDLAEPLFEYFGPRAASQQVRLRQFLAPDLPLALADAEKIYWVLFQLLDNAIKFTPAGGEVMLTAEVCPEPGTLRVAVRDTGIGIAPERLGQIFQPFQQATTNPNLLVDGTGLGLALVKRIIEAHDSKVEVESRPNEGSTFAFELPLAKTQ